MNAPADEPLGLTVHSLPSPDGAAQEDARRLFDAPFAALFKP